MLSSEPSSSSQSPPPGRLSALLQPVAGVLLVLFACVLLVTVLDQLIQSGNRLGDNADIRYDSATLSPFAKAGAVPGGGGKLALPYNCPPKYKAWNCSARLRFDYERPQSDPEEPGFPLPDHSAPVTSLYIPYFAGHLRIYLNGTLLEDSQWKEASFFIGQSAPMLVPLPSALLRERNEIEIDFQADNVYGGFFGKVYIGGDYLLRRDFRITQILVVMLPRLLDGVVAAMALFMLLIWLSRPWDYLYLLFSVQMLGWAASALPVVLIEPPSPLGLQLLNLGRFFFGAFALPFAWLLVNRRPKIPIWAFLLIPATVYSSVLLLPGPQAVWVIWWIVIPITLFAVLIALLTLGYAALFERRGAAMILLGATALGLAFGIRDNAVLFGLLEGRDVMLSRYNGPLVAVSMGAVLIRRISDALITVERFNAELRLAVEDVGEKLKQAFRREQRQANKVALQAERMRLMSDLHDGIAGHLVSIISLCEQNNDAASEDVATASRRALTDLRLVVDSLEDVGEDLGMMLVAFRERVEPQLRRNRIGLVWRVRDLPDQRGLCPAATLAIFRILQEAVSNAANHARTPTVEISASASPLPGFGARLTVRDAGRGGAAMRSGGYGMANMRRRADTLGAVLTVESGAGGTTVHLDLPDRLETGETVRD